MTISFTVPVVIRFPPAHAMLQYDWKYVVVDEGHRLKNFNCKLIRELRTIPTQGKLLLTGTVHLESEKSI